MTAVKPHTRLFALFAAVALVVSFCPPPSQAAGKLNVMTATTDLAALAQEIGGDKVDVESIARGYQDPHFVEAKPSFLLKLRRAGSGPTRHSARRYAGFEPRIKQADQQWLA